jgi:NhaP-type Na+/H+ or K+/H+ antiporter
LNLWQLIRCWTRRYQARRYRFNYWAGPIGIATVAMALLKSAKVLLLDIKTVWFYFVKSFLRWYSFCSMIQ